MPKVRSTESIPNIYTGWEQDHNPDVCLTCLGGKRCDQVGMSEYYKLGYLTIGKDQEFETEYEEEDNVRLKDPDGFLYDVPQELFKKFFVTIE